MDAKITLSDDELREKYRDKYLRARGSRGGGIYIIDKWAVRLRDDMCMYCTSRVVGGNVNMVLPFSLGGKPRVDNMVLSCMACAHSKAQTRFEIWLAQHMPDEYQNAVRRVAAALAKPVDYTAARRAYEKSYVVHKATNFGSTKK